jgi:hypothetical protein
MSEHTDISNSIVETITHLNSMQITDHHSEAGSDSTGSLSNLVPANNADTDTSTNNLSVADQVPSAIATDTSSTINSKAIPIASMGPPVYHLPYGPYIPHNGFNTIPNSILHGPSSSN